MSYKTLLLSVFALSVLTLTVRCDDGSLKCGIIASPNTSVSLECTLTSDGISWKKFTQNELVDLSDDQRYTIYAENQTLVIKKVGEEFSGRYQCTDGTETSNFTVCVSPYVKPYDKPKNVIEGDPFQSECTAWGYPPVTVEWTRITKDGSEHLLEANDDVMLKSGSCENSTLRIKSVKNEDAGIYTCRVHNSAGTANATIVVNVKDKLAALWPFLGICAEVAVLCVIIFFYERRRAKRLEKEAASEETDRMNVNNETKMSEEVRHRK